MFPSALPLGEHEPINKQNDDFAHGATVSACEAQVRHGFLRKVFGIVAVQLTITAVMCAMAMYEPYTHAFALGPGQGLMLPGPGIVLLIFLKGLQGTHQQAGVTGRAQPHIHFIKLA